MMALMTSEGENDENKESNDAEQPNANGKKDLQLEDMQLWAAIDLNKDGKLTVAEYERYIWEHNAWRFSPASVESMTPE